MKRLLMILLLVLALAGMAGARGYAWVVSSFSTEGWADMPTGIAYDGSNFWITNASDPYLYHTSITGSVISSYSLSPMTYADGISWDGSALWLVGYSGANRNFYHVNTSGSIISSLTGVIPYYNPFDMEYLSGNCWVTDANSNRNIYLHNMSNGSIISSFSTFSKWPCGVCWDGTDLLITGSVDGITYRYTTTGSMVSYFNPAFTSSSYDGGTVWVNGNLYEVSRTQKTVYKLSIDWNPQVVEPTSLGVVRSLFR